MLGYCNGASKKAYCAAFNRDNATEITIPVKKNGCILTGIGGVFVIDLDVLDSAVLDKNELHPLFLDTLLVRTGSGGYHGYFKCNPLPRQTQAGSKHPKLSGVDIRSRGGIVFAPGCRFKDHGYQPYEIVVDKPITTITQDQFSEIWSVYGGPLKVKKRRKKQETRGKGQLDTPDKLKIDYDIINKFFPNCINMILTTLKRGEHLFHEERLLLLHFMGKMGYTPLYIMEIFRHVPDFDEKITREQVEYGVRRGYKPRNCTFLKENNMCPQDCGEKNPMVYFWRRTVKDSDRKS